MASILNGVVMAEQKRRQEINEWLTRYRANNDVFWFSDMRYIQLVLDDLIERSDGKR